ncbi:hypothetical protein U1Q18_027371 [Sarracenia purpurea var. burkii]
MQFTGNGIGKGRTPTVVMVATIRVSLLFSDDNANWSKIEGNKELVVGFNRFLPNDYKISTAAYDQYNSISTRKASVDFLNKIGEIFDDDDRKYKSFPEP